MKQLILPLVITVQLLKPWSAVSVVLSSSNSVATKHLRGGEGQGQRVIDVYASANLLDELKVRAEQCQSHVKSNSGTQDTQQKLNAARSAAASDTERAAIDTSLSKLKELRQLSGNACRQLFMQYYTVKAILGAQGALAPNCSLMSCGADASCQFDKLKGGAVCKCNRCFQGNGFVCKPATCASASYLAARPVLGTPQEPDKRTANDISVAVFRDNYVIAALQLKDSDQRGVIRIGRVGEYSIEWGNAQIFSGDSAAFGPVVMAHNNGRIAIAFRDQNEDGDGFFVGAQVLAGSPLQADVHDPHLFAHKQGQRMVLMPLASSRAVCLYAGHIPETPSNPAQHFGGAILLHLGEEGTVNIAGKYRFAHDLSVSRLTATRLTPTSMVVAYRALPIDPQAATDEPSQELSAAWIGEEEGELSIATNPFSLETNMRDMWGRALSLISQNLISYTYQSATEKLMKMVILHVDHETHALSVVDGPRAIGYGDAKFVQAISLDPGMLMPHSFTYWQQPGAPSEAEVCRVSAQGTVERCGKAAWADSELASASGARLADGRLMFAYVELDSALPYSQVFGAQEFLQE